MSPTWETTQWYWKRDAHQAVQRALQRLTQQRDPDELILPEFCQNFVGRKVVHSVMKARLQQSFDGHRARDTSIFLYTFSLQHFNFLLLSDPMFPFSIFISLFSNRSSSRNYGKFNIIATDRCIIQKISQTF